MTQKRKLLNCCLNGCILEKFKDTENFFETVSMSRSTICFKINLYKLVRKYICLQKSTLSANYFKNNFKKIKSFCKKVKMNISKFLYFSPIDRISHVKKRYFIKIFYYINVQRYISILVL